uniref:Secreted protein n=1 Tax=Anopheles marajoara TaxID=58244 RepID=A0A2M4C608_9DIPT
MTTTSPTATGRTLFTHLLLLVSVGRYSRTHFFQNTSAILCEVSHDVLKVAASLSNGRCGLSPLKLPNKKWLGVSGGSESRSIGTSVSGRELTVNSTSIKVDSRTSSVGSRGSCISRSAFFTDPIRRSQDPPKCGAPGGLNTHRRFGAVSSINRLLSTSFSASFNSRDAPMKFVPQSLISSIGLPRRAINRRIARMQDDVFSVWTSSTWIALVVRHINSAPPPFLNSFPNYHGHWPEIVDSGECEGWPEGAEPFLGNVSHQGWFRSHIAVFTPLTLPPYTVEFNP